ncbi:MAG: hypothetical protein ACRDWS_00295 [Acidimicrobiia bacterium]
MSKWSIAGAWVLVAALATTLTWQIVSTADAQVSDRPPLQVAAPLATSPDSTTTTVPTAASTSPGGIITDPTSPSTTTSSTPGSSPTTTSTSSSPPTTASGPWSTQAIPTLGGVVVVSYRAGEVMLSSASPAAGFAAELKKTGPPEVDVEFESVSAKFRVRVAWSDGNLAIETDADVDG